VSGKPRIPLPTREVQQAYQAHASQPNDDPWI
jgi:hypothetical protein